MMRDYMVRSREGQSRLRRCPKDAAPSRDWAAAPMAEKSVASAGRERAILCAARYDAPR